MINILKSFLFFEFIEVSKLLLNDNNDSWLGIFMESFVTAMYVASFNFRLV